MRSIFAAAALAAGAFVLAPAAHAAPLGAAPAATVKFSGDNAGVQKVHYSRRHVKRVRTCNWRRGHRVCRTRIVQIPHYHKPARSFRPHRGFRTQRTYRR